MSYDQATTIETGARIKTRTGRCGEVLYYTDSGLSRHFSCVDDRGSFFEVHSANCHQIEGR